MRAAAVPWKIALLPGGGGALTHTWHEKLPFTQEWRS
jgi:hypothetical protein